MKSKFFGVLYLLIGSMLILSWGAVRAEGFYVGAGGGIANIEIDESDLNFEDDDFGWKIYAGYRFMPYFAVEGGYADLGEPDDDVLGVRVRAEVEIWSLYAVGILPFSDTWEGFGKVGIAAWDADLNASGLGASEGEDGEDLALGLGVNWNLNEQWLLRTEWEYFDIDDADTVWLWTIGGAFKF